MGKQIFLFIFFSIIFALLIYFLITSSRLRKLGFQINQLAKDFNKEIDQAWGVKKELLIFNAANPAIGKITTLANRFANRQFTAITISNSTKLFSEFAVFVTLVVCASYVVGLFDLNYEAFLISIALLMRMAPFVAALSVFVAQLALLESVYSIVKDALNE